jgi:hypothetical protein
VDQWHAKSDCQHVFGARMRGCARNRDESLLLVMVLVAILLK